MIIQFVKDIVATKGIDMDFPEEEEEEGSGSGSGCCDVCTRGIPGRESYSCEPCIDLAICVDCYKLDFHCFDVTHKLTCHGALRQERGK
jgi:hypothetical protein